MESYLGRLQVCHAADVLNSYCQSILGEILKRDAGAYELVGQFFPREKSGELSERLFLHRASDHGARRAIRDGFHTYWSPESDVIVILRNKFVHQSGYDPAREVEAEIRSKSDQWCIIPPTEIQPGVIPVRYSSDDWLESDLELGSWAELHVRSHIHFMDQNLCTRFDLPRNLWRSRSMKRKYGSTHSSASPPVPQTSQPLQMSGSDAKSDADSVETPPMTTRPTQKEIDCSHFMRNTFSSFGQMGMDYAKQIGANFISSGEGMPGVILNHTIRGHDLEWEIELKASENDTEKSEFVRFRMRESDFDPFMTIWGTSSMMKDFPKDDIPEKAKRYLEECIEKTFTGSRH
jgi:hypothetical protein